MQTDPNGGYFSEAEIGSTDDYSMLMNPPQPNTQAAPAGPPAGGHWAVPTVIPTGTVTPLSVPGQSPASPPPNQAVPMMVVNLPPNSVQVPAAVPRPPLVANAAPPMAVPEASNKWDTKTVVAAFPKKEPVPMGSPMEAGGSVLDQRRVSTGLAGTVSALLSFLGFWYLTLTALGIGLIELGNRAAGAFLPSAIPGAFLRAFPAAGIMVVAEAVLGLLFVAAALKSASATINAWKLALMVSVIAVIVSVISGGLQAATLTQSSNYLDPVIGAEYAGLPYSWLWRLVGWGGLISAASLILLPMAKKEYTQDQVQLTGGQWGLFLGIGVVVFVTVSAYFVYQILAITDTSYGKNALKNVVKYHIYHAAKAPGGRIPKTQFAVNTDAGALMVGRDDFIQTIYDFPLAKRVAAQTSSEITLRQIQVGQPFDLTTFSQTVLPQAQVETLTVSTADQQQAFGMTATDGKSLKALAMLTPDSVLVLMSSKTANLSELLTLAESLR